MKSKLKTTEDKDPFFALKYIAYLRTGQTVNEDDLDMETIAQFAKWQICKVRNVLWNDPIWDSYTTEELMVEFFAIKFDESEDLRNEFEAKIVTAKKEDLDWLERMERKDRESKQGKINEGLQPEVPVKSEIVEFHAAPPSEFED